MNGPATVMLIIVGGILLSLPVGENPEGASPLVGDAIIPVPDEEASTAKPVKISPAEVSEDNKKSDPARWQINLRRKYKDDQPRAVARIRDNANGDRLMHLYAACRKGNVSIWADLQHEFTVMDEKIPVTVELDGEKTLNLMMGRSYDFRSVGQWKDAPSRELLSQLRSHQLIKLSAKPYLGNEVTATFNIGKIDTALKPIAHACSWDMASK